MQKEVGRKFLLNSHIFLSKLQREGLKLRSSLVEQMLIVLNENVVKYLINEDDEKKILIFKNSKKIEKKISQEEYEKLKKNSLGKNIVKRRFYINFQNHPAVIDLFLGNLDGLATLKVKFQNEDYAKNFKLPPFVRAKEITENKEYSSSFLTLYGAKGRQSFEIDSYSFFKNILILHSQEIKNAKKLYLNTQNRENFLFLDRSFKKIYKLFSATSPIFDERSACYFSNKIKNIMNRFDLFKNLTLFKDFLKELNIDEFFHLVFLEKLNNHKSEFESYLMGLEGFLNEFEIFIHDRESFYKNLNFKENHRVFSTSIFKESLNSLKKSLNKIDESKLYFQVVKVYLQLKKIDYLMSNFSSIYVDEELKNETKDFKKITKRLKNLISFEKELINLEKNEKLMEKVLPILFINETLELIKSEKWVLKERFFTKNERLLNLLNYNIKKLKPYIFC